MNTRTIIVADDHPAFLEGVVLRLEQEEGLEVTGTATNGEDVLQLVLKHEPDLLLVDIEMPRKSGLEVAVALQEIGSSTKVLPLSSHSESEYVYGLLENGAAGYLLKEESLESIINAIWTVLDDGVFISARVSQKIVARQMMNRQQHRRVYSTVETLLSSGVTPRLFRILQFAAEGMGNEEIAAKEFRSAFTVRNQVDRLKECLGVRWRPALVAWAWRAGIPTLSLDEYKEAYRQHAERARFGDE